MEVAEIGDSTIGGDLGKGIGRCGKLARGIIHPDAVDVF